MVMVLFMMEEEGRRKPEKPPHKEIPATFSPAPPKTTPFPGNKSTTTTTTTTMNNYYRLLQLSICICNLKVCYVGFYYQYYIN